MLQECNTLVLAYRSWKEHLFSNHYVVILNYGDGEQKVPQQEIKTGFHFSKVSQLLTFAKAFVRRGHHIPKAQDCRPYRSETNASLEFVG